MPSLAEIMQGAIQSGLRENNFEQGYQAKAAKDLQAQKALQEAQAYQTIKGDVEEAAKKGRKVTGHYQGATYGIAEQDPLSQLFRKDAEKRRETSEVDKLAKTHLTPIQQRLQGLDLMHSMMDDPSSINEQKINLISAYLNTPAGMRVYQQTVANLQKAKQGNLISNTRDMINYMTGRADPIRTQAVNSALRKAGFQYGDELEKELDHAEKRFRTAGSKMTSMYSPQERDEVFGAYTEEPRKILGGLKARKEAFYGRAPAGEPAPAQPGLKSLGIGTPTPAPAAGKAWSPDDPLNF